MAEAALSPDEVRSLLRECVAVVRPGEILVLRPGADFTPNQLREVQQMVDWWLVRNAEGIKALVIPGEAAQIVRQEPAGNPVADEDAQGKRTEFITREYDDGGDLITETVTVKTVITPKADAQPEPGGYL